MKTLRLAVLAVAMACSGAAATIYDNTATDTFITYFFSTGGFLEIGDTVTLAGTERTLTSASVQFYNAGGAGTFTAALTFHEPDSPVGAQLGSPYLVNGISMDEFGIRTVTFSNLNLLVPGNTLVFTVAVSQVIGAMDLGLNAFEPPSVGSSDGQSLIVNSGSGYSAGLTAAGEGNLYFRLDAADVAQVPEPSTLATAAGALLLGLAFVRRRRE